MHPWGCLGDNSLSLLQELRLRETRLLQSQETEKQELETVIRGKDGELQTMTRNVEVNGFMSISSQFDMFGTTIAKV